MPNAAETFALAWRHHQANDLARAEELYREVLQSDSAHADAWCFLGAVCQARGNLAEAESSYRRALHFLPKHGSALNCLGVLLAQHGKGEEAAACFQKILVFQPNDAEAHNNLGLVLAQQGRKEEAIASYNRALEIQPGFAAAQANMNLALGRRQPPIPSPARQPATSAADAAYAANLRGVELAQKGSLQEAATHFQAALQFQPDNADAHNNMGNLLGSQKKYDEAIAHYQKALRFKPDHVMAHYNVGVLLGNQGKEHEAVAQYRRTLQLDANHVDANYNLAILLARHGKVDEAIGHYDRALQGKPDYAEAHWNRVMLWLVKGEWERGWPAYEWRWVQPGVVRRKFTQPLWDGSPLKGRTILLHAEQGLGDTLQFIRYAARAKERGGKVIVECQPPLLRLLKSASGIDELIPKGGKPAPTFDVQAPLMSLPGIFRTTVNDIPQGIPYLRANSDLVEQWRHELEPLGGFKIGISWQGSPTFREDRHRSIPLAQFAKLAEIEGVRLISLQKGPGNEQVAAFQSNLAAAGHKPLFDLSDRLDEKSGAFMDTAAVMMNLDLVISSDTAVPHLAGALGIPVWMALHLVPDWRWLLHREDCPWYPTMRLFRQAEYGRWDEVFQRISEEVKTQKAGLAN